MQVLMEQSYAHLFMYQLRLLFCYGGGVRGYHRDGMAYKYYSISGLDLLLFECKMFQTRFMCLNRLATCYEKLLNLFNKGLGDRHRAVGVEQLASFYYHGVY